MKLVIDHIVLSRAMQRMHGTVLESALANIGLKADAQVGLKILAADSVLAVFSQVECQVISEGTAFITGRLFLDLVRELPDGMVMVEVKDSQLFVAAGQNHEFQMRIPLIEDMAWKEPKVFQSSNVAEIPCDRLNYCIEQVQFCVAHESTRNYGSVAFLHKPDPQKLRLVGTDGFRLSYCDLQIPTPDQFLKNGICLSKRSLNEIQRMCNEGYENLRITVSEDQTSVVASVPGYDLFIRLASVKYPNYVGVLPTANLNPVKLSRTHVQDVTKRVMLAADKTRSLKLYFEDSLLTVSSRNAASSEGKESLKLTDYKGTPRKLSVNGKFLIDVFSAVPSDDITLQFRNEDDPIVIIPQLEPSNCKSMHVLVPMKEQ